MIFLHFRRSFLDAYWVELQTPRNKEWPVRIRSKRIVYMVVTRNVRMISIYWHVVVQHNFDLHRLNVVWLELLLNPTKISGNSFMQFLTFNYCFQICMIALNKFFNGNLMFILEHRSKKWIRRKTHDCLDRYLRRIDRRRHRSNQYHCQYVFVSVENWVAYDRD